MAGPDPTLTSDAAASRLLVLREVGRAFNSSLDLTRVFQLVLEKVMSVLSAEAASIWLVQDGSKELLCETAIGPVKDKVQGLRLPWGTGIVGWVTQNAKPVIVSDAQKDKFLSKQVDSDTGFITRSMICAPMIVRGKCLGAIQIVNKVDLNDLFTRDDLELLADMAIDAGIAVENARLYQTESKVKELHALLKISREITSTLDLDRILKTVVNILSTIISYDRCAVSLLTDGKPSVNAISGQERVDHADPATKALETALAALSTVSEPLYLVRADAEGMAIDQFKSESFPDAAVNAFLREAEVQSLLLLPLKDEEGLIGHLSLESKTLGAFKESNVEIVGILVAQVTVGVRNAQLYRQVPAFSLQGIKGLLRPKAISPTHMAVGALTIATVVALAVFPIPLTIQGAATLAPADQVKVTAREGGRIERLLVEEGSRVAADDILAELDTRETTLGLAMVETGLAINRVRIQQLRLTSDAGAIALEEIKIRQAEAQVALTEAKIAAAKIRAPIAGVVTTPKLGQRLGATLSKGEELLEIARVDQMTLAITLAESDLAEVLADQTVSVHLLAYPTRTFRGKVRLISPKASTAALGATFTAKALVENPDGVLKGGMQGNARIEAGKRPFLAQMLRGPISWFQMQWWRLKP